MFYTPKKNPFTIDPFKSLIFPRPIGWISSVDKKGNANLAPYSYFNAIADNPPQIMFASAAPEQPSKFKDSLANILETKEFVVNFATSITRKQMNLSSLDASKDQDEFVIADLKKRKSRLVKPPSVADSPVNLECKLLKTLKLKSNSRLDINPTSLITPFSKSLMYKVSCCEINSLTVLIPVLITEEPISTLFSNGRNCCKAIIPNT